MRTTRIRDMIAVLGIATAATSTAQEEPQREYVTGTFAGTQVVNTHSVEVVPRKRSFGFMIQHRFGEVTPDEEAWNQFVGLDLPANIRFAFQYSPLRDVQLELGRSKNGKVWDLELKARLLKQTEEEEMPVSLTVMGNAGFMSDRFPRVGERDFFADGVTPFEYTLAHRFSYNTQIIVGRRFNRWFSAQLAGIVVYRNLVPVGGSNLTLAIAGATRFKVSPKGSILLEASPILEGRQASEHREPVAIAYEVATHGHVFQIVLASSQEIIEPRLYTLATSRYDQGRFHLGFNIARTLFVKPKRLNN
ncbi:MAG: hypothetical protein IPF41_06805 [Flavobacteriales bacterium]|nr:hypothetical protein [Flavobacteriales bacterium]